MKKIYAVNAGSYSDYRVIALFSTTELAEEFMAAVSADYNTLEEFDLDPKTVDLIKRGYSLWYVCMLRNGDTEVATKYSMDAYSVSDVSHRIWRRTEIPAYKGKDLPDCLVSTMLAKDKNHAIKIANELRVQMIADGGWD